MGIFNSSSTPILYQIEAKLELGVVDDFRTVDWVGKVKYPELVYQQSLQFLH